MTLPFNKLPARMIIELIYCSVFWLNAFPHEDGVSDTLSPRCIIDGMRIDYNKHCRLEFGNYVQTHEEHDRVFLSALESKLIFESHCIRNSHLSQHFYALVHANDLITIQ